MTLLRRIVCLQNSKSVLCERSRSRERCRFGAAHVINGADHVSGANSALLALSAVPLTWSVQRRSRGRLMAAHTTMGPLTWPSEHHSRANSEPFRAALGRSRDRERRFRRGSRERRAGQYKQASNRLFQTRKSLRSQNNLTKLVRNVAQPYECT